MEPNLGHLHNDLFRNFYVLTVLNKLVKLISPFRGSVLKLIFQDDLRGL